MHVRGRDALSSPARVDGTRPGAYRRVVASDDRASVWVRIDIYDPAKAVSFVRTASLPAWPTAEARRYRDPQGLLEDAVRQWFEVHVRLPAHRWPLGLPSVAVRRAWEQMAEHADYSRFCSQAFGRDLPVTDRPAAMPRTWEAACRAERVDARAPSHLPVLFLLDQTLGVSGGGMYRRSCGGRVCRVELPEVCVRHAFAPPRFWSFYRDDSGPRPR